MVTLCDDVTPRLERYDTYTISGSPRPLPRRLIRDQPQRLAWLVVTDFFVAEGGVAAAVACPGTTSKPLDVSMATLILPTVSGNHTAFHLSFYGRFTTTFYRPAPTPRRPPLTWVVLRNTMSCVRATLIICTNLRKQTPRPPSS